VLSGPNGATTPVAPGQTVTVPGRILSILDGVLNLAFQKIEGYDFEVNYRKRTTDYGQFSLRSSATYSKFYGFTRTTNPANLAGRDGYRACVSRAACSGPAKSTAPASPTITSGLTATTPVTVTKSIPTTHLTPSMLGHSQRASSPLLRTPA